MTFSWLPPNTLSAYGEHSSESWEKREVFKENKKDLYLHIEDKFGHNQGSSLKVKEYQQALLFTFIEKYIH